MMSIKIRFCKNTYTVLAAFLIVVLWMISGCSRDISTGPSTPQVSEISISPQEATLEAGNQFDFSVFALSEAGDTVDTDEIDIEWQWWSTEPDVFTVEPGGIATGQSSGEAFCVVEATVSISQNIAEELDIQYTSIGINGNEKESTEIKNMKLILEDPERLENEIAALKENRLRFVGRDSAIVFIF